MQVILLGLPGAGKGTQAAGIVEDFRLTHISTGDMFRAAAKGVTVLSAEIRSYIEAGLLVPDELTIRIVRDRISQDDAKEGFLLDGFPRTGPQAQALDNMLAEVGRPVTKVLYLEVGREELLQRLGGRWICPGCGATYHSMFQPPRAAGVCNECGTALQQRADDRPDAVRVRLEQNWDNTQSLVAFYEARGLLERIAGDQPIDRVRRAIRTALRGDGE